MARSLKHTHNFKYTKHSKVFADPKERDNMAVAGSYMRALKKVGVTQIILRKHHTLYGDDKVEGYTVVWYTRKDLGLKVAVAA